MNNRYAVIESSVVVNVALADPSFAESQGWVSVPESEPVSIGWFYIDGKFVEPAPPDYSAQNKTQAESLLQETDWTQMPDVDLINKADFITYRAALRAIAVNPPVTVAEWPVKPEEVWPQLA